MVVPYPGSRCVLRTVSVSLLITREIWLGISGLSHASKLADGERCVHLLLWRYDLFQGGTSRQSIALNRVGTASALHRIPRPFGLASPLDRVPRESPLPPLVSPLVDVVPRVDGCGAGTRD